MSATFTFPTRIIFGENTRASLAAELKRLGVSRPLLVTDPGLEKAGLSQVIGALCGSPPIYSQVQANPTEQDVLDGLERYRSLGCDGLIGLGGGSPIDAAKAIRLLSTHGGSLADYDFTQGGLDRITPELPPMIALPTTAGTGTEAGRGTLIQLASNGRKTLALSPHLLPSLAICDPELTLSLGPELTAGTGMDAFTHCVESYLSTTYNPLCDGIALEGLRHISRGLESSVREGQDRQARREMMMGSLLGGISFHKGLGVVHSLSHALGSHGRVHHGTLNAILLPHALRFNLPVAEDRISDLAQLMGVGRGDDGPRHFITLTELVLRRLPLPRRLGELQGLERSRIPYYAALAMQDHCHRTNPRPCEADDMERLLELAW